MTRVFVVVGLKSGWGRSVNVRGFIFFMKLLVAFQFYSENNVIAEVC